MSYIYFDESGQISGDTTKPNISNDFYCTLMITDSPKSVERCVKKTIRSFSPNQMKKFSGPLHAYKELDTTRKRLLQFLSKTDIRIVVMKIDKQNLHRKFHRKDASSLYQYAITQLFKNAVRDELIHHDDVLILSRFFVNEKHNNRLIKLIAKETKTDHCIIEPSNQNLCLQAVDFIAWSYYMKCEKGNSSFFDLIDDRIVAYYTL